ncbi:MAG: restriction endonuclease [Lachnospiraceae bacterium]|nr:restriction endonuclease [Lachnospiraceae bacterium]
MAKLDGLEFEDICATVLKDKGFKKIRVTKASGDQGVDILASKDGKKYAVQCKLYSRPVGNKAVQEVYAGMSYYDCDVAIVMTNSTFTKSAIDLAESTGVELWEDMPIKPVMRYPYIFALLSIAMLVMLWFTFGKNNVSLFFKIAFVIAAINGIWYLIAMPIRKLVEKIKNEKEDEKIERNEYEENENEEGKNTRIIDVFGKAERNRKGTREDKFDRKSIISDIDINSELYFDLIKWSEKQIDDYIQIEEEYASAEDARFFIMAKEIVSKRRVFYRAIYNECNDTVELYYYSKDGVNEIVTCVSIEVKNIIPEDDELYIAKEGTVVSYIQSFEELCDELLKENAIFYN